MCESLKHRRLTPMEIGRAGGENWVFSIVEISAGVLHIGNRPPRNPLREI